MKTNNVIQALQKKLDSQAIPKTKTWWENYMRGVIPFRGVGIPEIRNTIASWRTETEIATLPDAKQLEVALKLFEGTFAEDKLAGILFIQDFLQDRLPWKTLFDSYEELYAHKLIFDWNTCDWFCVRVLGPTLKREGLPCAKRLRFWSEAPYLWLARSGVVPFIKAANDPRFYPDISAVCAGLIKRDERFAKTSVGWLLRDVSRYDTDFVKTFLDHYASHFSSESLSNACKYFDKNEKETYRIKMKSTAAGDLTKPKR